MGSSEPNQPAISSGIPLPQWMKSKMNDRYDVDQPFSPPAHDDTFFYIRYPKSSSSSSVQQPAPQQQFHPITDVLAKHPDFSKHTAPCRQFIPQANTAIPEISLTKPKKSQGTDDGFHGEGAACGKSVVHVAQQMIAGKFVAKNFNENNSDSYLAAESYDFGHRRGSKSLPASPLSTPQTSPRLAKKSNHNPYFTGQGGNVDKSSQEPKYQGWILSGFLGQRSEQQQQQLSIPEETAISASREDLASSGSETSETLETSTVGMRRNKSTSMIGRLMRDDDDVDVSRSTVGGGTKVVRPKASGLREMNFWSPTSM